MTPITLNVQEIEQCRRFNTMMAILRHRVIYGVPLVDTSRQCYVYIGWKNTSKFPVKAPYLPANVKPGRIISTGFNNEQGGLLYTQTEKQTRSLLTNRGPKPNSEKIQLFGRAMDHKHQTTPSTSVPLSNIPSFPSKRNSSTPLASFKATQTSANKLGPSNQIRLWIAHLESVNGEILLDANHASRYFPKSRSVLVWCELWRRWKNKQRIRGRILNQVYGGYSVGVAGFVAFLPASRFFHVSRNGVGFLDWFEIANMNPLTRNIVVVQSSR